MRADCLPIIGDMMTTAVADFKGYKTDSVLLVRAIDRDTNIVITQVVVVKILGDHIMVKPSDKPTAPTMTFSRKTGLMSGSTGYDHIPNSQTHLVHFDDDGEQLLASFKAKTLKPLMTKDELVLRKTVEWLKKKATFEQIMEVVDSGKLLTVVGA